MGDLVSNVKVRIQDSVLADMGAMHKYAAPVVPTDHAREAHRLGLDLQAAAVQLDHRHAQDHQQARKLDRMRRIAWWLVLVAAILVTLAAGLVGEWWVALNEAAVNDAVAAH
jgi:hypothetical protein